ncbi:MAG: ABC transporter permease, partial [Psychrosphaera sp.]|nr:ABC transporter permease [Psychrosphaera sp.]
MLNRVFIGLLTGFTVLVIKRFYRRLCCDLLLEIETSLPEDVFMLLLLLKFEWQLHSRQPVFLLGLLACGFFGGFLILNQSVDSAILVAGPFNITSIICTMALMIMPFLVSAFTGNAIVRDRNAGITELVFSTPIKKWHYLLSRWLGLVVMSCLVFMAGALGILVGLLLSETATLGILYTTRVILWPVLVLILPGIVLLSSTLFAVGLFFKKNIAVYVAASVLFLLYQLLAVY